MSEAPAYSDILALVRQIGGKLPCDVMVPPATRIKAGASVAALLAAMVSRRPVPFTGPVFADDGRRLDAEKIALDLNDYNVWRRGEDEDATQPDPKEVGRLIDDAVLVIQTLYHRVDQLTDALDRRSKAPPVNIVAPSVAEAGHLARAIATLRQIESFAPSCSEVSGSLDATAWRAALRELQRAARLTLHEIEGRKP